jgi:hypothetical protein
MESNDRISTWPTYCGDRIDVWISEDRMRRAAFRARGGRCILEFSGPAFRRSIRIPFELHTLRKVLLEEAAFAKAGEATCAIGRWGRTVEICMISDVGVRCSIPVGRYIAVLGFLSHRLRQHARKQSRSTLA